MWTHGYARDASFLVIGAGLGVGAVYFLASRYSKHVQTTYEEYLEQQEKVGDPNGHARRDMQPDQGDKLSLTPSSLEQDDIINEQLTRNIQFFGMEGQKKITDSFVVVVGLGGVGSHAAHMLLRAGVGKLRLVDFDQVSLSSLNRHCLAVREDVGTQKSACLAKYFREIMPEADIESMCTMYCKESEEQVLSGSPDYVIDAIDNIDTKVDLLGACSARGLPVLSVAGAGAKADPTRLRFVDIVESCCDPLARSVRARLKRNYGISSGITILLSTERPRCGLVDSSEAETAEELLQYQIIPNFRIRTIPVLGTTPSMFGMAAAGYVLCELAGQHIDTEPFVRFPEKAIKTQYDRLESRIDMEPDIDMAEVEVLIREIWRGESARSKGPRPLKGISKNIGDLHLTLWDPTKGATVDNLVLLTKDEAENHDLVVGREGLESLRMEEPEFAARVERALERARRDFKYGYY